MRGKGINYDTGFLPGEHSSRPDFDPAVVAAEMRIIARELGCTAVRVSGSRPERISIAAQAAAAEGLEGPGLAAPAGLRGHGQAPRELTGWAGGQEGRLAG